MPRDIHLSPPFRAEHVGSLLRPKELYEQFTLREAGEGKGDLDGTTADNAVKSAVGMLKEVGIRTITDGEMKRDQFFDGVFENLEGMVQVPQRPITEFKKYISFIGYLYATGVPFYPSIYCNGKIKRTKPFYVDQFKYLKSVVAPEEVPSLKVNICAPTWFHQRHGSDYTYDRSVYKNDDEYFDDLAIAYRSEIKELYDLGCRHIQIDDPTFAFFCHPGTSEAMKEEGVDAQTLLNTYIRAINVCTEGRPEDLTVSLHICRGNFRGQFFCAGGYEPIAEVFHKLDVDAFYLEFDDERSGSFAPLKHIPRNKAVVLGLVTTKKAELETVDQIKERVDEAAGAMAQSGTRTKAEALNQICISPQCGFASTWQGNPITEEDQKQKLSLLVRAAKEIWPEA